MQAYINEHQRNITVTHNIISFKLTNVISSNNQQIKGFDISHFPDELQEIRFVTEMKQVICNYDKEMISSMSSHIMYSGGYTPISIEFVYDKEWIANPTKREYGPEVEFFDGKIVHTGKQIFRKQLPPTKEGATVTVTIPKTTFNLISIIWYNHVEITYFRKVLIKDLSSSMIDDLIERKRLQIVNEKYGYLMNILVYMSNICCLKYFEY